MFLSPRWVLGHLFAVAAFAVCLYLGWWQLDRFDAPTGGPQNAAYALQWPVFGVFILFFWYRAIRDELRTDDPTPVVRKPAAPRAVAEQQARIRRDEEADPQLAAYNAYLAELNEKSAGSR